MSSGKKKNVPFGARKKDYDSLPGTSKRLDQVSTNLPSGVTQEDVDMFNKARNQSNKLFDSSSEGEERQYPGVINFGKYEIVTWYSSPYPQDYAVLPKLCICEFCLNYTKTNFILQKHQRKCTLRHPPGNEIYRSGDISVFEVDGNINKIYCQNVCLIGKLFIEHKILFIDVEPFLFYVLTKNDITGCHFIGYFSKEKYSIEKFNVSCIMILPPYQKQGYGRFLIEFSYLLSRVEGKPGTPETPLSDLGRISYQTYWKSVLLEYFYTHKMKKSLNLDVISKDTGILHKDISVTLNLLNFITYNPSENGPRYGLCIDWEKVDEHMEIVSKSKRIIINPDSLRWAPWPTLEPYFINERNSESPEIEELDIENTQVEVLKTINKRITESVQNTNFQTETQVTKENE